MPIADFRTFYELRMPVHLEPCGQVAIGNWQSEIGNITELPTCGFFDCSGLGSSFLLVIASDAFGEGVAMDSDGGGSLGEMLLMSG